MATFSFESNYPKGIISVWIEENETGNILVKTDGLNDGSFTATKDAVIINAIVDPDYVLNSIDVSNRTGNYTVNQPVQKYGAEPNRYRAIGALGIYDRSARFNLTKLTPEVEPEEKGIVKINGDNIISTATNTDTQQVIELINNVDNELLKGTYDIKMSVVSGYEITNAYYYNSRLGNQVPLTISDDKQNVVKSTKVLNNTKSEYYIETAKKEIPPEEPENPPTDKSSRLNNVYSINHEILNQFTTERFTKIVTGGENFEVIDLSDYIINLIELPLSIPKDIIGKSEKIKLGDYNINTISPTVKVDEVIIDIGTINVKPVYNNSLDYVNTTIILHLPFMNSVELDPNYIIDCDVNLKYVIDLYTSNTTLIINSSKTGNIIFNDNLNIGRQIPFLTAKQKQIGNISEKNGVNNNLDCAYMEVIRNAPHDVNRFDLLVNDTGLLKDVKGSIIVDDIELISNTTLDEKENIKTILRNGVVVK